MSTPEPRRDFFVSFTAADRAWAEWIAFELETAGYTTYFQHWDFRPGSNFVLEMQKAAASTGQTIAVLSPQYLTSLFAQPEWAAALATDPTGAKRKLIPVRVAECVPQGILAPIVYADLVGSSEPDARRTLLAAVSEVRPRPDTYPAPTGPPHSFPGSVPPTVPSPLIQPAREARLSRGSAVALYAALSLANLLLGLALFGMVLYNADTMVRLGLTGRLFYLVFIPAAIAAAASIFQALRSVAAYRGRTFGATIKLGGPVVAASMVILSGLFLPLPETSSSDPDTSGPDVAGPGDNLGSLSSDKTEEARKAIEETLVTYRNFARANPDTYLPHVAATLNDLGVLHHEQNRMVDARKAYGEALAIWRTLALTYPDTYLDDIAQTLNNLGQVHKAQNRMEDARNTYDEALATYRTLARANPGAYLRDVAQTLNNLGQVHKAQNRMEDAREAYDGALGIRRKLARADPDTYLWDVAETLNNLGNLHSEQNRMGDARKAYEEALTTYRTLARANPGAYVRDVAMVLNNLGSLHGDQYRTEDARKAFDEALAIQRTLARANPDRYLPDVALTLSNLGALHASKGQMTPAQTTLREALAIYENFARTDPERFQPNVDAVKADLTKLGR